MDFERASSFLLGPEVRAIRCPADKTLDAKRLDGTPVGRIEVPAGHWVVVDEDGVCSMEENAFRALYLKVPGDERSFVRRGVPVRAVRGRDGVSVEGRDETIPGADFDRLAVRLDSEGAPLCRASLPMWRQAKMLRASPNRGAGHLDDLRSQRAMLVAAIIPDPVVMADIHMLDGMLASKGDKVEDSTASVLSMMPSDFHDGAPADLISKGLGVDPQAVVPVTRLPTYREAAFRSMARTHLQPYLGGLSMEDAVCLAVPNGFEGIDQVKEAVASWLEEGDLVAVGAKVAPPEMPGYETSELRHVRFEGGLDVLAFEDLFGTYVYGWRSPGPAPQDPPPGMRLH